MFSAVAAPRPLPNPRLLANVGLDREDRDECPGAFANAIANELSAELLKTSVAAKMGSWSELGPNDLGKLSRGRPCCDEFLLGTRIGFAYPEGRDGSH